MLAERVAARFAAELGAARLREWATEFPRVLQRAKHEGLPSGWVWRDSLTPFFEAYDAIETEEPPPGARVSDALAEFKFMPRGSDEDMAYSVAHLKRWWKNFTRWLDGVGP